MVHHQTVTVPLPSTEQTYQLGQLLGQLLPANSIVLLQGDLGAGKTTLVQGIGFGLQIQDPIVSPTFTLINEYHQGRLPLYHFDLYRLQSSEIIALAPEIYWEGLEVTPGITAIEWAEFLPYRPDHYLDISLIEVPSGRQADITFVGAFDSSLKNALNRA